jgi:hypothetical protein
VKHFSDFAKANKKFEGEKIRIDDLVNKEIKICDFKIEKSKVKKDTEYLTLNFELDGMPHICFTGSKVLREQIETYKSEIPFLTTILKIHRYYTFS